MAESIVSITIETLWGLLKEEAKLLSGVSDQIDEVCTEFKRMQCFLQDAEARQHKEQTVRNWIREIRSLAYRAEDVIETYAAGVSSRRGRGFKKVCKRFACILAEARELHKIGTEIGNIKAEIAGLTSSLQTYGIRATGQEERSRTAATDEKERWLRMTYAHEVEDSFVGMKDDIKQLKAHLLDDEDSDRVVSIWGMGGSGKTTVARKIFNDDEIQRQFDAFAWVCITQQCQIRKVLEDILEQLYSRDPRKENHFFPVGDGELVEHLYKQQKEKKCLVVLDDIWNTTDWGCLKKAFPIKESPSKILLTTRNKEVADVGYFHKLNYLKSDEAWELLQKKALIFGNRNLQDSSMEVEREKIGREMVRKCGYLPLAISVLGGILSINVSLDEWRAVNKDVDSYLSREGSNENRGVMQILTLSYDVLPYHLKQCFLSFGHFPKNLLIGTSILYCTWMAEGIVSARNRSGREETGLEITEQYLSEETGLEVAEQYLSQLASRSMVELQLHKFVAPGVKYFRCHLHDLMRELCIKKCLEEDFVKIVDFQAGKQLASLERSPVTMNAITTTNTYRLAIYANRHVEGDTIGRITQRILPRLRSIMFTDTSHGENWSGEKAWTSPNIFKKFKYLRILYFDWYTFVDKKSLEVIEKLIHLRFIYFANCKMEELPIQVFNLPFLQSLDFVGSEWKNPTKMPRPDAMWRAKKLRRIFFARNDAKLVDQGKFRLRGLVHLEEIIRFNTDTMEAIDLVEQSNLRRFAASVFGNKSLSLILSCIEVNWLHIRHAALFIYNCNFIENEQYGTGSNLVRKVFNCRAINSLSIKGSLGNKLPRYETNLVSSLTMLRLSQSEIVEDPMEMLETLPKLKLLELQTNAFMGKEMVCHRSGFPSLTDLFLQGLPNLENWRIEEGAMLNLSKLGIGNCENLAMIPNGLRFISTLKELVIADMSPQFKERIRTVDGQEGVDFEIVRHLVKISLE